MNVKNWSPITKYSFNISGSFIRLSLFSGHPLRSLTLYIKSSLRDYPQYFLEFRFIWGYGFLGRFQIKLLYRVYF